VGENLQDQINVVISASTKRKFSDYPTFVTSGDRDDLFGADKDALYQHTLSKSQPTPPKSQKQVVVH
jgi:hypothetical protein